MGRCRAVVLLRKNPRQVQLMLEGCLHAVQQQGWDQWCAGSATSKECQMPNVHF